MKKTALTIFALMLLNLGSYAQNDSVALASESAVFDIEAGKTLFKSNCSACHSIGKGRLVGPDLKDVHNRLEMAWIIPFVKSATAVIESGDEYANKLFLEYDSIPMADHAHLTDQDIGDIVAYIKDKSEVKPEIVIVDPIEEKVELNPDDVALNKMSFWGGIGLLSVVLIAYALSNIKIKKYQS